MANVPHIINISDEDSDLLVTELRKASNNFSVRPSEDNFNAIREKLRVKYRLKDIIDFYLGYSGNF